jgi:small subunit ribosomal protein S8e
LVRTNTLVKGCIVEIDAAPFRQWYEAHYAVPLGRKKASDTTEEAQEKKSNHLQRKLEARKKDSVIEPALVEQFVSGKVLGKSFFYLSF